jgi:hydrogenase-1 operon protein HyaE
MSEVFASLLAMPACESVGASEVDGFLAAVGPRVLFLTGETTQRPEASDVAVVVRELMREPDARAVRLGIVDRRDEAAVMRRLGVVVTPSVVLIRDGQVQEIIGRMRDWQAYAQAFARLLGAAPAAAGLAVAPAAASAAPSAAPA